MLEPGDVAARMKHIRETLGLKQKVLARSLGVSTANISDVENGKYKPKFDLIVSMVAQYNINIFYLFFGEGEMFMEKNSNPPERHGLDNNFVNKEEVSNFLHHLERSPLVEFSSLYSFRLLMAKDGDAIRKEIEDFEKKKSGEEEKS